MEEQRSKHEARLLQRAARDPEFRRQLLADPRSAIETELGYRLPESVEIRAVEETPNLVYLVLPAQDTDELSEVQLEALSGGYGSQNTCQDNCTIG